MSIATDVGAGLLPVTPTGSAEPICVGAAVGWTARLTEAIDPLTEAVSQVAAPIVGQEILFTTVMG